jgi:hypothetical protein
MDERVTRLRTPEECDIFATNATARKRPDLALEARRKAVDLKVATHSADTPLEKEALAALYSYETALTHQKGKKVRATRTWQLVKKKGILKAAQQTVCTEADHQALLNLGLEDLSLDALIQRHPESFSAEAVESSAARMAERRKI